MNQTCDRQRDCDSGSDEENCGPKDYVDEFSLPAPAVVNINPKNVPAKSIDPIQAAAHGGQGDLCPESHFQCPDNGYCLPVFLRCNGVHDCPCGQDEQGCVDYTCAGYYRCRGFAMCVHSTHVCDGLYQCPQKDDELFCNLHCPLTCTCYGLAFTCHQGFQVDQAGEARYLDVSFSGLTPHDLSDSTMLVFLSLAHCRLTHLNNLTFPNIHILDVSHNDIHEVTLLQLSKLPSLQALFLAGNPLSSGSVFSDTSSSVVKDTLQVLDLSHTRVVEVSPNMLTSLSSLLALNLSNSSTDRVWPSGLYSVSQLRVLDVRGCPLTHFSGDILQGMKQLEQVFADNYKLCCPVMLPDGFNTDKCVAPLDEISSCDALLRSNVYRVVLSLFSSFALMGNVGSFLVRVVFSSQSKSSGYAVMVAHLCVSDFLMGLYLAMVGVADRLYLNNYLWKDVSWRHSIACMMAGFLSLISSEVSAVLVCLVSVDRFLALRFPFSRFRFNKTSATVACALTWIGGCVLAAVPILPGQGHWQFYSQSGICIPLPVTRKLFPGHHYAFGVMIVFNFMLFALIASGQAFIFTSIRANRMAVTDSTRKSQDFTVARRLISVAMTDFVCWFPLAVLGLMAAQGVPVSSEVSVALAIFVLPLNSALNPFLYNLSMVLERRQRAREERLLALLKERKYQQEDVND